MGYQRKITRTICAGSPFGLIIIAIALQRRPFFARGCLPHLDEQLRSESFI
jgi:hypothetical protein